MSRARTFPRPPGAWVSIIAALSGAVYAVEALHEGFVERALSINLAQDTLCSLGLIASALLARKRPLLAGGLAIALVWCELMATLGREARVDALAVLALPVLMNAAGMLLGGRMILWIGVATVAAFPASIAIGRALRGVSGLVTDNFEQTHWLLTAEFAILMSAQIARLTWNTYRKLFAESEHARRRYAELFEQAPDGLLALDPGGTILEANAAANAILGLNPREIPGLPFSTALARAGAQQALDLCGAESGTLVEVELPRGPQASQHLEIAVRAEPGERHLLVVRDVTARRVLEERLSHSERLETVGKLAGGIAHDFNNILTVVACNAELLRKVDLPEVRAASREILDAQRRGTTLIKQILAFARRDPRRPKLIEWTAALGSMSQLAERVLGERHSLDLSLKPPVPVVADAGQLEQVVMNLLTNARDAMASGGVISVRVRQVGAERARALGSQTEAKEQALLEVQDRGVGIDPESRKRIFEPFFTTKERGQGTGLGLAMVQGLVAQSGGSIAVESVVGEGSTFRVFLPIAHPSHDDPRPSSHRPMNGLGSAPR